MGKLGRAFFLVFLILLQSPAHSEINKAPTPPNSHPCQDLSSFAMGLGPPKLRLIGHGGSSAVYSLKVERPWYLPFGNTKFVRKYFANWLKGHQFKAEDFHYEAKIYGYLKDKAFKYMLPFRRLVAEQNGHLYLEFNYLPGRTLSKSIEMSLRQPSMATFKKQLRDFDKVLEAFEKLHGLKVLHGDIKGQNIFITRKGEVKIFDFTSAQVENKKAEHPFIYFGLYSKKFAPPEILKEKGDLVGYHSDVYSLAKTLETQIVTPFLTALKAGIQTQNIDGDLGELSLIERHLNDLVLDQALQPDSKNRTKSMKDFRVQYRNFLEKLR